MDVQVVGSADSGQQQPVQQLAASPSIQTGAPQPPVPGSQPQESGPLSPVVAKIFGQSSGSTPQPVSVNVSYRVVHDPNMIVTVFTDPKTGQEIAQVPAEVLVQIAQFFDKESGVTLDRSA